MREGHWLSRTGIRLSDWFEHWFPDAFAFAAVAVVIVFAASVGTGNGILRTADWFGQGFWELVKFTMQMVMIIVTGYALATSPPVAGLIGRLASWPKSGAGAAAFVATFSMLSSLLSWSFSLIFSGLLAREVCRRVKGADYRAVGAAAYMGLGSVWALGLSSSPALIMATSTSMPESLLKISGVIPLRQTIGLWQSLVMVAVLLVLTAWIAHASAPPAREARGLEAEPMAPTPPEKSRRPGEWLEHSPVLSVFLAALGGAYLAGVVDKKGPGELLDLNNYIFLMLLLGLLLHWRPRSFVRAVAGSVGAAAGILIQYPLYAGILRVLTESGLASRMAHAFVAVSSETTFPVLVAIYSALLGIFVPSAGGKWLIEAPYLLEAAKNLQVHLGWVVQVYNASEALPNLIHPFWMLPLLGMLNLKPRDIIGFTSLQFVVHVPVVLFLVWCLNLTLSPG